MLNSTKKFYPSILHEDFASISCRSDPHFKIHVVKKISVVVL